MKIHSQIPLLDRLWMQIDRRGEDECWPWIGKVLDRRGYGRIKVGGKKKIAHRQLWMAINDTSLGRWQLVLHKCDNPGCCNPKHLRVGTPRDNNSDMMSRGRNNPPRGERSATAKMTRLQVVEARRMKANGATLGELCRAFGLSSRGSMSMAVRGQTWSDVTETKGGDS